MKHRGSLAGMNALVTGSTGEGMGRQVALTLAREGANMALNYGTYRTSARQAGDAVNAVAAYGVEALAIRADTRREKDVRALVSRARRALGPLDIVVANAGGDFIDRPLDALTLAQWQRVVQAELDGAFLLARSVVPAMRRRGHGRLVFISWEGAARAYRPPFDYAVGKLARDALADKLARSEEGNGVMVNTVSPGYIPYPTPNQSRALVRHGPAWRNRRRSTTQDVAEAVLWLCQPATRFVSGSTIRVYGPH